jgi:hypothetical protein
MRENLIQVATQFYITVAGFCRGTGINQLTVASHRAKGNLPEPVSESRRLTLYNPYDLADAFIKNGSTEVASKARSFKEKLLQEKYESYCSPKATTGVEHIQAPPGRSLSDEAERCSQAGYEPSEYDVPISEYVDDYQNQ